MRTPNKHRLPSISYVIVCAVQLSLVACSLLFAGCAEKLEVRPRGQVIVGGSVGNYANQEGRVTAGSRTGLEFRVK